MRTNAARLTVVTSVLVASAIGASPLTPFACRAEERVLMSCPLGTDARATHRIISVDGKKREARIEELLNVVPGATEGWALLIFATTEDVGPNVAVAVEVKEILDDGSMIAIFGHDAAALVKEGPATLFRPFSGDIVAEESPRPVSTKAIRELPDVIRCGAKPPDAGNPASGATARDIARRSTSVNQLKSLALALLNYESVHGALPPAAVIGPDGKPWHSWRVLILPFLGENDLHEQYDYSQSWDSPKNQAVANKMPSVFRDPAREGPPDGLTDYAAIVGKDAIFQPNAVTMKSPDDFPECLTAGKRMSLAAITDGLSNTIMFATVDPARKIPWTKPEDILLDENFPGIGKPAGIGAIHPVGNGLASLVAFAQGMVATVPDTVGTETLRKFLTRAGGEVVEYESLVPAGTDEDPLDRPSVAKVIAGDDGRLRLEID
jgi:hypothetical protein